MQVTFEAKITDTDNSRAFYPSLEAYAALYGQVERALFRDLYVRDLPLNELKQQYQPRFGITARQFNSVNIFLEGKVKAVKEGLALRLSNLREKVTSTEKSVKELAKKLALATKTKTIVKVKSNKQTPPSTPKVTLKPSRTGAVIGKLRFKLHNKKRRLHLLRTKLAKLEKEATSPVPRLTFGSNKLFRAQFHLKENGFRDHEEWLQAWRAARSSQFVCVGSKDENNGNQSCTYFPDSQTLRLRLPSSLIPTGSSEKYLTIPNIAFRYGGEVISAAIAKDGGQAMTFRFIRRTTKTRSGNPKGTGGSAWYVQVTTERKAAPKVTDRRLGAIGIDLNPALIAVARIDRYGNPVMSEIKHYPIQLHKRSSEQIEAALADVVAEVVKQAVTQNLPIVIEKLDFTQKKNELKEKSNRYARMLSAFAYRKFYELIHSRASRFGIEVIEVNPAFTSVIGLVKFKTGYGLSTHAAAAVAIARRALRFGEVTRTRSKRLNPAATGNETKFALIVPVRIRFKHVWSQWRVVAQRLRALKTRLWEFKAKARGRPLSESTSGGSPSTGTGSVTVPVRVIELSYQSLHKATQSYALWL
jgi:IS605 OrfB family transposase